MAEQPSDSIDTLDDKSEGEKLDSSEEILRMTDEVDSSLLRLQLPLQSSSSPATPSSEILDDQGGLSDVDGEAKVGENQKRGSQKRNRSAGPRLMILNPASSSNNSNSADREGDSNPRIGSSSSSDCKPRRDFNFQFSSELEKSFPVSGEVEAKIFSGSRKFVKLDSLLSQNKEPMSCPVLSNQMKGFLWKEDGENSDDEEPLPSLEDMEKPEMTRRESFFQLKKENVAQQRLISVDREQCHKKEQAELCMEEVPDMKQQQAVTVCRSNTWSFKNSSEAFEKLRTTSLKRQSSYIETEADRRSLRQRQRQQTPHRQHPVIVERDEEEVGGEEERATMSDDTDDRPCHMRHRSNTVSNVVKSYSIVDRDFRYKVLLIGSWIKMR